MNESVTKRGFISAWCDGVRSLLFLYSCNDALQTIEELLDYSVEAGDVDVEAVVHVRDVHSIDPQHVTFGDFRGKHLQRSFRLYFRSEWSIQAHCSTGLRMKA